MQIVGNEEMVSDWTTDHCAMGDVPDLPVRAFRDANGMIQMNVSNPANRRLIGPSLDSLKKDCTVVLGSDNDPNPAHYDFREWLGSTYTLDGKTVYAMVHNEFYGNEASQWYAQRDFANGQGVNNWRYQGWNGSSYSDMRYDAQHQRWQGNEPLCQIGPQWQHPDRGCEPARTWTSPVDGTVTITGAAADLDPGGGDGVIVKIFKGGTELWSATIDNGDPQQHPFDLQVSVQTGDSIYFRVNARNNNGWDTTLLNPKINVGPDPCPSGQQSKCFMAGVTFAESTDGGKSYQDAAAPNHLLADLPYRYEPDGGMFGMWQPSNIVKNPKDGYYYALIQLDQNRVLGLVYQGMCAVRTQTLNDPTSWRAWDGKDFEMRFVSPYDDPSVDAAAHTCAVVSPDQVGALSYSLTYNSYFDKFIAVGHAVNVSKPGFYFALSDDLIHWTPRQLLMAADLVQTTKQPGKYVAYPSLVDPTDTSRNFEVTGQNPYLYFSRFNSGHPLEVDLLRLRLQFGK